MFRRWFFKLAMVQAFFSGFLKPVVRKLYHIGITRGQKNGTTQRCWFFISGTRMFIKNIELLVQHLYFYRNDVLSFSFQNFNFNTMNKFSKREPEQRNYLRPAVGAIILLLGAVFMLLPFIPLGYIFIFGGLFLLSTEIPLFKRWLDRAKAKDDKGRIDKVEKKVDKNEDQLINKVKKRKKRRG